MGVVDSGRGGDAPHCHCMSSVAGLNRLLAKRDVAWSLMVDLQLDEESQYESSLAAALLDVAPPNGTRNAWALRSCGAGEIPVVRAALAGRAAGGGPGAG